MKSSIKTTQILTCGGLSFLIILGSFLLSSCKKEKPKPATAPVSSAVSEVFPKITEKGSQSSSSSKAVTSENIKTKANTKLFMKYCYNYFDESVGRDSLKRENKKDGFNPPYKCKAFNGTITKDNAEAIIRYAIDNSFTANLDKYSVKASDGFCTYYIPKDVMDKVIMKNIDCSKVDSSLFECYNSKTKKYVIGVGDFGGCGETFGTPVIKSITKTGEKIEVKADFYKNLCLPDLTTPLDEFGFGKPDTSWKYQSTTFTFKKSGNDYQLLKVAVS